VCHRQQVLIAGQLQPFQLCCELELGLDPATATLDADAPSVREGKLHRCIGTVFIQADPAPAVCCQAESGGSDPDPGGIAEANLEIEFGWIALLRQGARDPVGTLVVATQIEMHSPDAHSQHRSQPLKAEQGIDSDADALNGCARLITGASAHLHGTKGDSQRSQTAVTTKADGMSKGLGNLSF
tara:strand:+ start:933 stop:1484 length:552 start_codon:yes stop_codon:yes gene_type:complete